MNLRGNILWIMLALLGSYSCSTIENVSRPRNLADMYNPSRANIHPQFMIYHVTEDNSIIYVRIFTAELLFNQANDQIESLAKFSMKFNVREYPGPGMEGELIDSATIQKTLNQKDIKSSYFTAVPLKAVFGKRYSVEIFLKDEKRGSFSRNFLLVDKTSEFNAQNFRVLSSHNDYPLFTNTFSSKDSFRISFNKSVYDSMFVDYYPAERNLPRPLFATSSSVPVDERYPDSIFTVPYHPSLVYNLPEKGSYHFRFSLEHPEGLTLFNFGKSFPAVKTPDELLAPLVYLASSAEFRELQAAVNRKLAIDDFWLNNAGGSIDDARELIRVYYSRVLYSNLWFTTSKEGWKTDRGMIYMIFGAPDALERAPDEEKWIYFDRRRSARLEFIFDRQDQLFSGSEYVLRRSLSSTSIWTEAVSSWRKGKIYSPVYK